MNGGGGSENKRPKDTTEHGERGLGIERRKTALRVRPVVEMVDIG